MVLDSSPYGPIEKSELRTTLDVLTHQEIAPWISLLESDDHGKALVELWVLHGLGATYSAGSLSSGPGA